MFSHWEKMKLRLGGGAAAFVLARGGDGNTYGAKPFGLRAPISKSGQALQDEPSNSKAATGWRYFGLSGEEQTPHICFCETNPICFKRKLASICLYISNLCVWSDVRKFG